MKATYLGMDDKARKVRKMYIGIDDVTRKVKRAYIGVNGVARLFYTSDFFIAKGLSMNNVVAAYQFKGAKTQDESKKNLTGNSTYDLSYASDAVWSQSEGLTKGTITNSAMAALGSAIKTQIVYYSNFGIVQDPTGLSHYNAYMLTHMKPFFLMLRQDYGFQIHASEEWKGGYGGNKMGIVTSWKHDSDGAGEYNEISWVEAKTQIAPVSAVFAGSSANKLYLNGSQIASSAASERGWPGVSGPHSDASRVVDPRDDQYYHVTIIAAAFYNCYLTDAQHLEIANSMRDIK